MAGLRAAGCEASGVTCDVSDLAQVEALAEHAVRTYGRFDVWINNAGYAPPFGPTMHIAQPTFMQAVQTKSSGRTTARWWRYGPFCPRVAAN